MFYDVAKYPNTGMLRPSKSISREIAEDGGKSEKK